MAADHHYRTLACLVPPITLASLEEKNDQFSITLFRRARLSFLSNDISALTLFEEPGYVRVQAYIHRHSFQHCWFLATIQLPKEGMWRAGTYTCACQPKEGYCSHTVVLLMLVSSLQADSPCFPVRRMAPDHPLMMYSSVRETQLPWSRKLALFTSRVSPSERRTNLLQSKPTMKYHFRAKPEDGEKTHSSSWPRALQELDRRGNLQPVAEEPEEFDQLEHDNDDQITTAVFRRSQRTRSIPLRRLEYE